MDYSNLLTDIKIGKANKTRLKNKTSYVDLWWEDADKWFMNVLNKGSKDAYWVIEKDLLSYLDFAYGRKGYAPEKSN